MICPHCQTSLRYRERPNHRCGTCRREFALDPKDNPLLLHDVRMRQLVEKLSDDGRLHYTVRQLWYAAARKTARSDARGAGGLVWFILVTVAVVLTVIGVVAKVAFLLVVAAIMFVITLIRLLGRLTGAFKPKVVVRMTLPKFRWEVIQRWIRVYGAPPPGLLDEERLPIPPPPPHAGLVVLCPDTSVRTCLEANGVPKRLGVALTRSVDQVPSGLPVLLLHDTSVAGYQFAAHARAFLPGRTVVDASPRPSALKDAKNAFRLREPPPPAEAVTALRGAGLLAEPDLEWLAKGWWSPIAAMRPAAVIARVEAVSERATADPDRRAAAAVGFMTWPTS